MKVCALLTLALAASLSAQAQAPKSVLGTLSGFNPNSAEIEVKPDNGAALAIKIGPATVVQRITPGQTDLSKAEVLKITDVGLGDRILATLGPDGSEAKRIVVIPSTDLAKRDAADAADWQKRGVAGVVTAVSGADITVEVRSLAAATKYTVTTGPKTTFKKYAPDSVRYSDANDSTATDVRVGDQLRARGTKNPEGTKVEAEAVVFGTFLSRAGTITAINLESKELTIKDLASNRPVIISFTADSRVKRMPDAAAMGAMMGGGRGAGRGPGPTTAAPPATPPATPPSAAGPGRAAGAPGASAPRGPDIAQMLELLPPIKFEDLKTGEIAVLSAIQGARPDRVTAITFLANAETLVQMAMAARGNTGPPPSLAGLAGSISNVGP
jgi:hypothetical protein